MAIHAKEADIQRLVVIPVVPFEPKTPSAPGADLGTINQPETLSKAGRISR